MRSLVGRYLASGRVVGTALVVVALAATLIALLLPVQLFNGNRSVAAARQGWEDDGAEAVSTPYGPLTALDRSRAQGAARRAVGAALGAAGAGTQRAGPGAHRG